MGMGVLAEQCFHHYHHHNHRQYNRRATAPRPISSVSLPGTLQHSWKPQTLNSVNLHQRNLCSTIRFSAFSSGPQPLDLTEDNIRQVLADARVELGQLFDDSVGITGQVELAELDGPFVRISLKGRFWHKRSTVVARLGNYLKQRIPEILEVDIEDEKQLDDSPENF